jgi:hypothetical protein
VYRPDLDAPQIEALLVQATPPEEVPTRLESIVLARRAEPAPSITLPTPQRIAAPPAPAGRWVIPLLVGALTVTTALVLLLLTEPPLELVPERPDELPRVEARAVEAPALDPVPPGVPVLQGEPVAAEEPRAATKPRAAPRRPQVPPSDPAAPVVPEVSVEVLMARLHEQARTVKRSRPELSAAVDDLINTGLFETAAGDTPEVRAKLKKIAADLERLKGPAGTRGSPPDR